ncbi:hypothetical protein ACFT7S_16955 [Streptomyces sp. NPDC057136]|uniref:hypothetical protein n=1 Tax=Streptomyces sp. NPDC057136 TaxID=3346029 RepID=UPI003632570E
MLIAAHGLVRAVGEITKVTEHDTDREGGSGAGGGEEGVGEGDGGLAVQADRRLELTEPREAETAEPQLSLAVDRQLVDELVSRAQSEGAFS